ncbi:hypothetical protein [Anaplasma phagocytophilum]|uniref:hypothetical protein n=1 Tax=Anaplasma phagocytophilum TaxID=948 RepID=UPI0005C697AC|nr:hypothetical protein [Anaplasma phagocytophilum]
MVKKVLEEGGGIYTENSVLVESSDEEETRPLIVGEEQLRKDKESDTNHPQHSSTQELLSPNNSNQQSIAKLTLQHNACVHAYKHKVQPNERLSLPYSLYNQPQTPHIYPYKQNPIPLRVAGLALRFRPPIFYDQEGITFSSLA